jgi:ketosteroid isomerase-like protein
MPGDKPRFDPKLIEAWVSMWNTYDLSMVDALFLKDRTVTYFSSEKEGIVKGISALRKHHEGFGFVKGGKVQPNRLWLEDIDIEQHGPTAIVTAVWCFKRADSETVMRGPVTFVYVLSGKEYRIAHAHFSNY